MHQAMKKILSVYYIKNISYIRRLTGLCIGYDRILYYDRISDQTEILASIVTVHIYVWSK